MNQMTIRFRVMGINDPFRMCSARDVGYSDGHTEFLFEWSLYQPYQCVLTASGARRNDNLDRSGGELLLRHGGRRTDGQSKHRVTHFLPGLHLALLE